MDTATLISQIRDADPEQIQSRLAEIAAEEKALREVLRVVRMANPAKRKPQGDSPA